MAKTKSVFSNKGRGQIDFKYNLKLYFDFVKRYKFLFFFVTFLIMFAEVLRIVDNFLFKAIVDKGTLFAAGSLSREIFVQALIVIAVIFFSVLFVKSLVRWLRIHALNRLEVKLIVDLKRKFFNHLVYLSHGFHTTHKTGSLISRLSRGGRAMEAFTDNIVFNFAPLLVQLFVVGASLIYFDVLSAVIVLITMIIFITYSIAIQSVQQEANLQENATEDIEKGNMADFFTNVDSVKY
ncbi:MAG: ABC transporter transmembrane domain-containing protein, partial [Nanoarchaeota archaeon]